MVSWQLWQALQRPYTRHALFRHLILRRHRQQQAIRWRDIIPLPRFMLQNNIWGFLWGVLLVLMLCSGGWLLIIPILALTPVVLVSAGTLHGAYTAIRTGTALAREREQGRASLNSVTPGGIAGASWAICSYVYHTNHTMSQMRDTVRGINLVLFIGSGMIALVAVLNWLVTRDVSYTSENPDLSSEMLLQVARLLLVLLAIYVDFFQSTVLGAMTGILASTLTRSRLDTGGFAFGVFMAVQLLFYVVTSIVIILILPQFFASSIHPILLIAQFGVFVLAREALVVYGYRLMAYRLQSDPIEMQDTLGLRAA